MLSTEVNTENGILEVEPKELRLSDGKPKLSKLGTDIPGIKVLESKVLAADELPSINDMLLFKITAFAKPKLNVNAKTNFFIKFP